MTAGRDGPRTRWRVRAARAADLPELHRIFVESSLSNPGDAANLLAHPDVLALGPIDVPSGRTRVAVDENGCVAGFATVTPGDGVLELEDLFVDPERMRRGAARALVVEVAALARAAGSRRIDVTANPHALAFYTRAGFVHDGDITTTFGPAPRMHLDLP